MKNPEESWVEYVYRVQAQHGRYAKLKGKEPFYELFSGGVITPFITAIRVMYAGCTDMIYKVNEEGMLYDLRSGEIPETGCRLFYPEEILSVEKCPYWWEVEGIKPEKYDERNKR